MCLSSLLCAIGVSTHRPTYRQWLNGCLALAGLVAALVAVPGAAKAPPSPTTLRVGILPNGLPPFSLQQNGGVAGIGADTLRAALGNPDLRLEPRLYPNVPAMISAACAQEIDIVLDLAESPDRSRCLSFSLPYFDGDAVTFGRTGASIARDTPGARFAVRRGLLLEPILRARYPKARLVYINDVQDGLQAVVDGRADFFPALRPVAEYVLAKTPMPGITEVSSHREPSGAIRFGLGPHAVHLLPVVNDGLRSLSDAQRKSILGTWVQPAFGSPGAVAMPFFLTDEERAYLATLPPLRVAFDSNRPPYAYLDKSGQPSGIAAEYLTWLGGVLGVQFQRVPTGSLAATADALRAGTVDMASVATQGNALWQGLRVSEPYATFPVVIVGRVEAPSVDGLHQLAGRRIVTARLTGLAASLQTRIPGAKWEEVESVEEALERVNTNRADVFIGGFPAADMALRHRFIGTLRVIGPTNLHLHVGFALRPELAQRLGPIIDRAISALPEKNRLDIQHHYVVANYVLGPSLRTLLLKFALPVAGLLLVIVVMSALLALFRREIRRRRNAESELSSQLAFQRILLDTIPVPMVVRDADGRFTVANHATERLVGCPRSALLGKTLREIGFWADEDVQRIDAACEAVLRTGEPHAYAVSRTGEDGKVRHFLNQVQPFGQTGNTHAAVICVSHEVTAEREHLEALSQARDKAEAALRAKDRFLALMSHEIRTPMSGILGLAELLNHTTLNQEQTAMIGMIEGSATTLMQILNDILEYSKIEADKVELEALPVDIRELCDMALGLLAVSAHEKGLRLRLDVGEDVAAEVIGDGLRLRRILINLLSNAIKFTEHGSISLSVRVAAQDAGVQTIEWCVADTGIGIAQALQEKLFDPFFQADASTTRRFGGTGLGLTICQKIVRMMGGSITVSSTPGHGAQFKVSVPMPVKALHYATPALNGIRARICLKDADMARSLQCLLTAAGAEVRVDRLPDGIAHAADIEDDLLVVDDDASLPADIPCAILRTTLKAKSSGYRLTTEGARLSVNPLTWHGATQAALAACSRSQSRGSESHALTAAPVTLPAKSLTKREEALKRGELILVAEDHPTNRLLLQRQLSQLGYASDTVNDGEQAWAAIRNTPYALLISDCHMPGINGYDLARRIRTRERDETLAHLPIIAITANSGIEEVERCKDAGVDVTLFKPVQLQALRDCVARYLPAGAKSATCTAGDAQPAAPSSQDAAEAQAVTDS